MVFCKKKIQDFFFKKNFRQAEVVAILVSFPTNVYKLPLDKEIPSYGRFSEKGSKTCKIL